jgi:hypothetical protein
MPRGHVSLGTRAGRANLRPPRPRSPEVVRPCPRQSRGLHKEGARQPSAKGQRGETIVACEAAASLDARRMVVDARER